MSTRPTRTTRGSCQAGKEDLLKRFNRVNGQVAGIAQMVEDERYCPEVLVQLSAAIAGLKKIGYMLLRDHIQHCVTEAVDRRAGDAYLDELIATVRRFSGH